MTKLTDKEQLSFIYGYLFNTFQRNKNMTVDEFLEMLEYVSGSVGLGYNDRLLNRICDFQEQLHDIVVNKKHD